MSSRKRHSDHELMDQMIQGETSALKKLFFRHYHGLCEFVFHYLRNLDQSEEVVSDLFIHLWERRTELTIHGNPKAYLFAAARNRALNQLARERRRVEPLVEIDENRIGSSDSRPDRPMLQREFEQAVDQLLDQLPPRRREIFRLCRLEGFAYKEIASILEISVRTVQNHMVLAVRDLDALQQEFRKKR